MYANLARYMDASAFSLRRTDSHGDLAMLIAAQQFPARLTAALFSRLPKNGLHRDVRERIASESPIRIAKYFSHRFPMGGTALHAL
jgi:hypothetical protein